MFNKLKHIHMIGIGGSGMSGIAEVLYNLGYIVTGSDRSSSTTTNILSSKGITVHIGHKEDNVRNAQVVVKSTAISEDNPEIQEAMECGIPIIPRAEMLAELMRLRTGIAVGGTHGKTTTTSFIASIFDVAKLDPTVIIGGKLNAYGANARLGMGNFLVAEADESDASFLYLFPMLTVVTNVDYDHIDFYKSQEEIDIAFIKFMNKVPFYGANIVCGDDEGVRRLLPHVTRKVVTYGFEDTNMIYAQVNTLHKQSNFTVFYKSKNIGEFVLNQPGLHNILNALAAIGIAIECGISPDMCKEGLEQFSGVGRRFDKKGEEKGVLVIDDYGHHPVEIMATLQTARLCYPNNRIIVAFQPHRFSRTQALFGDFCTSFSDIDILLVTEIYAASETPIPGITGMSLTQGILQVQSDIDAIFCKDNDAVLEFLLENVQEGDIVITLGAGSITHIGPLLLESLRRGNIYADNK
ncbi:MAG: UDP-N-acetylmuramate--L-alanine ligase [Desulfovibrionaceae bacterium]